MPTDYFSVDRRGLYRVGEALGLYRNNPSLKAPLIDTPNLAAPEELQRHLEEIFPDGLSAHGWDYMTRQILQSLYRRAGPHHFDPANAPDYSTVLELLVEYSRRSSFAHRHSRLQSYFAFASLQEAEAMRTNEGPNGASMHIYRLNVDEDKVFKADQVWLRLGHQNAIGSYFMHKYWAGDASSHPKWEHVLATPVNVVERMS